MERTIRAATPADYTAYTHLFAELEIPDPVPAPETFARAIAPQMRVACDGDAVIGYVTWRAYGETAHVVQLAVDRARRGQRIGERLLDHVRDEARSHGCIRWYLNVKRDNAAALRLYTRVGLRVELESWALKIAWQRVPPTAAHEANVRTDEDAAVAAKFGLPIERIGGFRARTGYVLVGLRDAGAIVGFAAFDPSFPGAATFSTARPELAGALLDACRPYADPRFDFIGLTVEGDRALADALVALGAEVRFEILRLSAELA
jgi:GNAT superfamily N-acetyltransferase